MSSLDERVDERPGIPVLSNQGTKLLSASQKKGGNLTWSFLNCSKALSCKFAKPALALLFGPPVVKFLVPGCSNEHIEDSFARKW